MNVLGFLVWALVIVFVSVILIGLFTELLDWYKDKEEKKEEKE